jgi:hypothetical protein
MELLQKAVREQARYSVFALNRQRHTRARLASQTAAVSWKIEHGNVIR